MRITKRQRRGDSSPLQLSHEFRIPSRRHASAQTASHVWGDGLKHTKHSDLHEAQIKILTAAAAAARSLTENLIALLKGSSQSTDAL